MTQQVHIFETAALVSFLAVLGMVSVQVERDSKTGATVIKSVSPMSTPAAAAMTTTVFDDGRKSVHTVGGSGDQPSAEELGQILSVIDGVGMKVLLDEVTVTPNKGEMKMENLKDNTSAEGKVLSYSIDHVKENHTHLEISGSHYVEARPGAVGCAEKVREYEDEEEDRSMLAKDTPVKLDNKEDQRMEEGPVTLTFLGYADAASGHSQGVGLGQEDHGEILTVERVIITDEGEEEVTEPEMSASPQSTLAETGKELQEVFQDIPLDGNGAKVQASGEERYTRLHDSSPPSRAEGEDSSKRKTCQCCSVM